MIIRILLVLMLIWLFFQVLAWVFKWFLVRKLKNFTQNPFSDHLTQHLNQHLNKHFSQHFKKGSTSNPAINDNEPLVQCAHCGIYITKAQAHEKENQYYCCTQHMPQDTP